MTSQGQVEAAKPWISNLAAGCPQLISRFC